MMDSILVVCEGNICRSPMAAGMLASRLASCKILSAGLNALVGLPAAEHAQEVMRERGYDISTHRATQIARSLCADAELILVMDRAQRRFIESQYSFVRGRVFRLGEYADADIHDPYRRPQIEFERCAQLIERCVSDWLVRFNAL